MAVAAHVSRVAKDYAPHGYSIMQEVSLCVDFVGAALGTPINVSALYPSDADIRIEEASIAVAVRIWGGGRLVDCKLLSADNDGSLTNPLELNSGAALNLETGPITQWLTLTTDQNQVVAAGRSLYVVFSKDGGAVDGADVLLSTVTIRYRRKA